MVTGYYVFIFICSLICTFAFICIWHEHVDVYYTLIYTLIPISNLGYVLMSMSTGLEEAILAKKIIYVGACFLPLIMSLNIINFCGIKITKIITMAASLISALLYLGVLSIGYSPIYYRSVEFQIVNGTAVLSKEYGPMHIMLHVVLYSCSLVGLGVLLYALKKKRNVSIRSIYILVAAEIISVSGYFFGSFISNTIELTPVMYVIAQILFLILADRLCLYDISETVVDAIVRRGDYGYISFDNKKRFLACNVTAEQYIPELCNLRVDRVLSRECEAFRKFYSWFEQLDQDGITKEINYQREDRHYKISIEYLYDRRKKQGYQITIIDDTRQQRYIELLNNYNTELEKEVSEKIEHIQAMQDKMILGMADMVGNRDNSTGGHIKRTSHGIRILIEEMRKDNVFQVTQEFCNNVIKAAPMHDLGKIAVDDAILRKPGRFTPEEFEQMKQHAAKGADIVRTVTDGINDSEFRKIAENVAHYHHERWDGSGYPEHLAGEEIPLEARIMAIADVYDALVSKRCYKERMSFDEAYAIIEDGMGKQFDPKLNKYFIESREKLEAYYMATL